MGMGYYGESFLDTRTHNYNKRMTVTGFIGTVCMFPLRAIIAASVALRIHPEHAHAHRRADQRRRGLRRSASTASSWPA